MTAQLGVAAAFELTWARLPKEAQQIGCRLSLFANAPFGWELVEACVPRQESTRGLFTWIGKLFQ